MPSRRTDLDHVGAYREKVNINPVQKTKDDSLKTLQGSAMQDFIKDVDLKNVRLNR